jgi:hypothetical protein
LKAPKRAADVIEQLVAEDLFDEAGESQRAT